MPCLRGSFWCQHIQRVKIKHRRAALTRYTHRFIANPLQAFRFGERGQGLGLGVIVGVCPSGPSAQPRWTHQINRCAFYPCLKKTVLRKQHSACECRAVQHKARTPIGNFGTSRIKIFCTVPNTQRASWPEPTRMLRPIPKWRVEQVTLLHSARRPLRVGRQLRFALLQQQLQQS